MNTSIINSSLLVLAAVIALTACDSEDVELFEPHDLANDLAAERASLRTAQYASPSQTSSSDYFDCIDECGDELYACEYDHFLACVYHEPHCGDEEVCEVWLHECLDYCEAQYGDADAGGGLGILDVDAGLNRPKSPLALSAMAAAGR